ncbi:hypothetical protein Q2100_07085, partial [Mycolicibacterium sp. KC 300]|nr:hypothetical protein [Mycolicibacterium arseniciresistens]
APPVIPPVPVAPPVPPVPLVPPAPVVPPVPAGAPITAPAAGGAPLTEMGGLGGKGVPTGKTAAGAPVQAAPVDKAVLVR